MSLRGSLYCGISGLNAQMSAMSVIGNNLANTNTYGFKSQRADFEDIFYSTISTANGVSQIGHGASVAAIMTDFKQGPYETTNTATNVAIGGRGYFQVRDQNYPDKYYYTRAGNFVFNNDGVLVDSSGKIVQGWKSADGSTGGKADVVGSPVDIKLDRFQSPPQATSKVSFALNLNAKAEDKSSDSANPFFAMFSQWNGQNDPPMPDTKYSFSTTIKVYDENGGAHDLTVHFDKVGNPVASGAGGKTMWEYTVTVPPSEDGRTINGTKINKTSAAGMLMAGTMTFGVGGKLEGMTAFTLSSTATGNLRGLNNWTPATFSANGYPQLTANFLGASNASIPTSGKANPIELDFGIRNKSSSGTGWTAGAGTTAASLGNTTAGLFNFNDPEYSSSAVTSHESSSSRHSAQQDGYASGFLQNVSINSDGVITGHYSNGQVLDLYVLTLAKFSSRDGLRREGSNLFSETRESGSALTGIANTGGLGKIHSNAVEQSNVDSGRQMVKLITTQRAFQANSKVITTSDSMLSEVIALKR